MNRQLLGAAIVIPADEREFLAAHYERCGNKHMAEEVRSDNYRVGWGMSEASFIQAIRDAVADKDTRIAALEKALEPFARVGSNVPARFDPEQSVLISTECGPSNIPEGCERARLILSLDGTNLADFSTARALLNPTPTEER